MGSRFAPAVSRRSGTCRTENRSQVFSSFVTAGSSSAVRLIDEWWFAPRQNQNEYYHTSFIQVLIERFLSLHLSARKRTKSSSVVFKNESFPSACYSSWKTWFAVAALKFVQDTWVKSASFMGNVCFWMYPWRCELGNCDTKPFECN